MLRKRRVLTCSVALCFTVFGWSMINKADQREATPIIIWQAPRVLYPTTPASRLSDPEHRSLQSRDVYGDLDEEGSFWNPVRLKTDYSSVFHHYNDSVEFRIIVLTFDRAASLQKALDSLQGLVMDGDRASLEIWIDRGKVNNSLDREVLRVARSFRWSRGPATVWIHGHHVGLYGQWIYTWRPSVDQERPELALYVEDDVDVAPYAYRWLRALHTAYGQRTDIGSYCLQDENALVSQGRKRGQEVSRPATDPVFLYRLPGSWGCAPHPARWRMFQDWYEFQHRSPDFHPYVPDAPMHTGWYKNFENKNTTDTMWTMWFIQFCDKMDLYCVYSNLPLYKQCKNVSLSLNRMEVGLHFKKNSPEAKRHRHMNKSLLTSWDNSFSDFPTKPVKINFGG